MNLSFSVTVIKLSCLREFFNVVNGGSSTKSLRPQSKKVGGWLMTIFLIGDDKIKLLSKFITDGYYDH